MKKLISTIVIASFTLLFIGCVDHQVPTTAPTKLSQVPFLAGLASPIGFALDDNENLWVAEAGTGADDASVSMFTPTGKKTTFLANLPSVFANGSIEGISHLLYRAGKLYILHGVSGMLYTADVSGFKTGDPAVKWSSLQVQDIGTYVKSLALTNPLNSNAYDLVHGGDDDLYIVDAGANAIIKRNKNTGELTKFAVFPKTMKGAEAVPTGIVYDGSSFIVTTLTGFPFAAGDAKIYKVDGLGHVSEYKTGFTTLTGLTLSADKKPVVIQYGVFGMGFTPNTGKVLDENGNVLFDKVNMPTDITRGSDNTYYLLSYKDGTVTRLIK
ncbi:MAG TPA: ScyD/ScyE family protein [Dyadobacter sp.]|jgi:hypothetical protein|nr:ScyD/ScyE family protein [Dyadobacter sp.]